MAGTPLRLAAVSDRGRRSHQEDGHFEAVNHGLGLVAVADGMGGHAAGEVASGLAVKSLQEASATRAAGDDFEKLLQRAARKANEAILEYARTNPEAEGLGTTLVAAAIRGDQLVVAHAGDSRAFLVTPDEVMPLTRDHSAVQEALDAGTIDEAEAAHSPFRHAILRNLGDAEFPGLEIRRLQAGAGSIVLLSSDGAHGHLSAAEILDQLCGSSSLEDGLERLLRLAYHNGSDDNITLVGCEIGSFPRSRRSAQKPPPIRRANGSGGAPRKARRSALPAVLALLLLGALGALGFLLARSLGYLEPTATPVAVPLREPTSTPLVAGGPPATTRAPAEVEEPAARTPVPPSATMPPATPIPTPPPKEEVGENDDQSFEEESGDEFS